MLPQPRLTSVPSDILIHPAVWPQQTLAENWGLCTFRGGGAGSPSNTVAYAEAYLRTKWHLDPCSRLTAINVGRKLGAPPLFGEVGAGSPSTTKLPAWAETYLRTKWHFDASSRWPFFLGVSGSPSNTKWPGRRKTSIPNGILVHQPFDHNGYWPKIGDCAPLEVGSWVSV